jgi:type IV secretory pathway VirB2 component (pilin)
LHDGGIKVRSTIRCTTFRLFQLLGAFSLPSIVLAQASPFDTGATSLVNFALTIATPIAVLIVIGLAIAAAVGKIAWGWVIGAIVGIAAIFGSPQIVAWIRSMFGV